MIFSFKMAWSYFRRIWSRGILGLMVIISIAGMSLGVASLVVTLSVMNGFHSEITERLLMLNPHLIVTNPFSSNIKERIKETVEEVENLESYASFVFGKGLLYNQNRSQGIIAKGIEPASFELPLTEGKAGLSGKNIVIGDELADVIGAETGDSVYLIIPRVRQLGAPVIPRVEKLAVTGVFSSGMYEYDSGLIYMNIDTVSELFKGDVASEGLEIYLNDPFRADKAKDFLSSRLEGPYLVQTWQERNYNLFSALKLEKAMMFIVLLMIIVVATFNIVGSLIMVAVSRSKDVGVMRAVGATRRQIRMMFNFKGIFIGLSGAIAGTALGVIVSLLVAEYQFIKLPPKVYLISTMPVKISAGDIGIITVTAVLISFLATLYPSHRACRMEVARELRSE